MTKQKGSELDVRRGRAQAAKAAAEAARSRLEQVDDQLNATAAEVREHETALRRASDEVQRRKEAVKAGGRRQKQLTAVRGKVASAVAKAQQKARAAEQKYDKAVLADLVRRERDRDLAAHSDSPATPQTSPAKPQESAKPQRSAAKPQGSSDPAPEHVAEGTAVSTETAARKTRTPAS